MTATIDRSQPRRVARSARKTVRRWCRSVYGAHIAQVDAFERLFGIERPAGRGGKVLPPRRPTKKA